MWLVPLIPLAWMAFQRSHGLEELLSPGPLVAGHQPLECRQCHAEAWRAAKKVVNPCKGVPDGMDRACAGCHGGLPAADQSRKRCGTLRLELVARPPAVGSHHEYPLSTGVRHCADCHREHTGGRITHVTDPTCTSCHADLRTPAGPSQFARHIAAFDVDHPAFGQWRPNGLRNPAALHFNHAVHLQLSVEEWRGLGNPLDRLTAQACVFCHQLDVAKQYMAPVRYDKHCAQCHPLNVQIVGVLSTPRAQATAQAFHREPVPHVEPSAAQAVIRERLIRLVNQYPELLDQAARDRNRLFPGKSRPPATPLEPSAWVRHQLDKIGDQLYDRPSGCRSCHLEAEPGRRDLGPPRYQPTKLVTRWFPHAHFSHGKHGLLACGDCHPARHSTNPSDILMPTREKCVNCHHGRTTPLRRARADCLECHYYHGPAAE
jgi:hypothetical protein